MDRIKVKEIIVVEGKYDKITVSQVFDCTVIETSGFSIFTDDEKIALLRTLAQKRGLIILTDGDSAGFLIRNFLKGALGNGVKHAYIPDISGKEKRKRTASREGTLGVEGMKRDVLIQALKLAGATFEGEETIAEKPGPITKTDLYFAHLSGTTDCASRRQILLKELGLPRRLTSNGLLDVLNALYTREEFLRFTDSPVLP
jgi:ribonuclease M5